MNEAEPLTPSYDDRAVPIPERAPEAPGPEPSTSQEPPVTPQPDALEQKPAKRRPKPRRKQKRTQPRKPLSEAEKLQQAQFRRDSKVLDLQLRIGNLRTFLQEHDLWAVFLSRHQWW